MDGHDVRSEPILLLRLTSVKDSIIVRNLRLEASNEAPPW